MSGSGGDWMTLQEFFEGVLDAQRSAHPFSEPEACSIFDGAAARDAHEHAVMAGACAFVWPFLARQQARGAVWLLLGNGSTIPARPALMGVGNPSQPAGLAIDLAIGTVGSARWPIEAEDFSGPEDFREETEAETQVRHGPFLGCPIVIDRAEAESALHELRHGPRASEKDIIAWAVEMWAHGGRPTQDIVKAEYRRNWPDATEESRKALWEQVRAAIPELPEGGRSKAEVKRKTDEFLEKKPHAETSAKPRQA